MAAPPRDRAAQRRLLRASRAAAAIVGALVAAALGIYVWARLSTDESTIARALIWMSADIGDQHRFPSRAIPASAHASALPIARQSHVRVPDVRATHTRAFVVVHHDRVVYARYFDGANRQSLETSFSIAKSIVSTLVGIAIDERLIHSIDDPITRYVPELGKREPRFRRITLRDLLTMSSGLRYAETTVLGIPWPWRDDTYTYYGTDLRKVALTRTRIEEPPGQRWHYNNYNPLLLGLVLERAAHMPVARFASTRLWRPLGAARGATWSLDSKRSGFEKLESGFNATALDYARLGLLFLHAGRFNGRQIVSHAWVRAATAPHTATDYPNPYGYFWWIDGHRPGLFYALGNYGQYVYIDPRADTVIVRLGSDWDHGNEAWLALFRRIADDLATSN
ncbi:MAG TPA: serine hydrolase [Solirubrobacteraceae bacterium]